VARTLAMNPRVLLLDEPLGALDALTRATLQDEISRLWQEDRETVVLITNDPDEAIYLADRVIPLTQGPKATLGPSIPVTLSRPRVRADIHKSWDFKQIRTEVVDYLLKATDKRKAALTRTLVLPNLQPEDISRPRLRMGTLFARPKRAEEVRSVKVETEF
jgi:nitrate/nitrite transport system ATP-binding protein